MATPVDVAVSGFAPRSWVAVYKASDVPGDLPDGVWPVMQQVTGSNGRVLLQGLTPGTAYVAVGFVGVCPAVTRFTAGTQVPAAPTLARPRHVIEDIDGLREALDSLKPLKSKN